MRVLFSTTAGTGHFGPLIPFAKACAAAGHTVAVASPGRFAEAVAGEGFTHLPSTSRRELVGEVFTRLEPTFEGMNRVLSDLGRLDAQAASIDQDHTDWRPDVVVRETLELGSLVAAERAGVAQLQVAIMTGRIGPAFVHLLEASLAELSTMAGLPPDRGAELLLHGDSLTSVPAALNSGDLTLGGSEAEHSVSDRGRIWRFRTEVPASKVAGCVGGSV
jgi:UDP:flavonoid glycosyltransferase YjiC (YdhE family)